MCGIAGGWWREANNGDVKERLESALNKLAFRGPDDQGAEIVATGYGTVAFGHTRLSIIDLSSAGHQPMHSGDKRFSIVFNGEIYNYKELRQSLIQNGYEFVSDSDTEVLLYSWIHWGTSCLKILEGMFAFAVYDSKNQTMTCVRDAFGIKPLYYSYNQMSFSFCSELPAIIPLLDKVPSVDLQSSYNYLVHDCYDNGPRTFLNDITHLPPAHTLTVDLATGRVSKPKCWWKPSTKRSSLTFAEAKIEVRRIFLRSIGNHLRSDVAVGAALSGGIDSAAVVCAMRHVDPDLRILTFSYIASDPKLSEEKWVDKVNEWVDAIPHKVTASAADLERDLDDMIGAQGEPFSSTSIYAQYRVFQLAREAGVTVTLDGQGADEILAGYSGYPGQRLLSLLEEGRPMAAHTFAREWSRWPNRSYRLAWMWFGRICLPSGIYARARRLLGRDCLPAWLDVEMLRRSGVTLSEPRPRMSADGRGRRVIEQLGNALRFRGLPALLRHGDRNSMRFSIESRVPFLTVELADLLLSLPEHYLISERGETKSVFRAALRGIVPDEILDRRDKVGFATPQNEWLAAMAPTLRGWLEDSDGIPFINREELLKSFDVAIGDRANLGWQVWRWVNYVRWFRQIGIPAVI